MGLGGKASNSSPKKNFRLNFEDAAMHSPLRRSGQKGHRVLSAPCLLYLKANIGWRGNNVSLPTEETEANPIFSSGTFSGKN